MTERDMTGGEAAVATLVENGVDTLFCLPGIQNDHFFNALHDHNQAADRPIRAIQARHEQGAGYMALGYAMATGGVGAFSVVPGPGLLNATAALATAYAVNARVLCLSGQIATSAIGKELGALHEIENQLEIIDSLTKFAARAEAPAEVVPTLTRAFEELWSGRPRPVGVEIPMDVLPASASMAAPTAAVGRDDTDASPSLLDNAASLLAGAERPMIFVGSGALDAGDAILELAEHIGAPVVSNRTGKGVIDERHPLAMLQPAAKRYWPECDVAIGIGSNMRTQLQAWVRRHAPTVISVDIDPTTHNRIVDTDVAITGDARAVAADLLARVKEQSPEPATAPTEIAAHNAWWAEEQQVLDPQVSYLAAIRSAMGDDGILVDELTQVGYVARMTWKAFAPRTFLTCGYQGTLGYGFPTAVGVKIARPDVDVISINGDGGFMFGVQELATAVQHRVGLIAIVFDNSAYGNVQMMQRKDHGGRVIATDLENPDFVKLAEAFGAVGARAGSPEELASEITAARDRDLPTVIHVPIGDVPSVDPFR